MQKYLFRSIPLVVWACVVAYVVIVSALCVFSYTHFLYAGLDLGIYDQVVWNTAHGHAFAYSFNPYSYLVDHREWWLLVIAPLYWIVGHPITLLILQTVGIALGALPLYLIAQHVFRDSRFGQRVGIAAVLVYLLHPSVLHMNLFEFHILSFVLPLSLWFWLCIEQHKWLRVWVLFAVLLLMREDVGLMTAGVGVLMMLRDRTLRKKGALMIVISLVWFVLMVIVGSHLAPDGTEKFLVFYSWLGHTPLEIVRAVLAHPLHFLSVLLDYDHPVILVFLCMDVAFLVLWAPKYLLPSALPLFMYLTLNQGMLAPVLKTHYAAVLVPWFLISALYGYRALSQKSWFTKLELGAVSGVVVGIVVLSQFISRGPLWDILHNNATVQGRDFAEYHRIIDRIGAHDSVMASSRFYPHLSERTDLYTTMHTFTGKQHFADVAYTPPAHLDWIVLEQEEMLDYAINLPQENRDTAGQRLQQLIDDNQLSLVEYTEDVMVFGHASQSQPVLPNPVIHSTQVLQHGIDKTVDLQFGVGGWEYAPETANSGTLRVSFERLPLRTEYTDDYHFGLTWYNASGNVLKTKSFALGNGTEPTHTWGAGEGEQRVVEVSVTQPAGATRITLTVGRVRAQFGPFFTVWTPGPMFDPDHSTTFDLTDFPLGEGLGK